MNKPLVVLFLTIFIDLLGFGLIIPILPILSKEIGAAEWQIGFIAAVYSLMNFLFAPFWGTLSDRIGRRPVILISVALTVLAYSLFAFATTLWILVLQRALSGIASANISAANAYIADISTKENRTRNMGLVGAAFGLGFIFGPPLGGWLKHDFGFEWVGYVAGCISLVNLVLAYFLLPESLKTFQRDKPFTFKPVGQLYSAFKVPVIRELFTINFIYVTAFSMMQVTASLLWSDNFGLNDKEVGYVFSFIGVSSAIVQGFLLKPLNKRYPELKLLTYGMLLMSIGLLVLPITPRSLFAFEFIGLAAIALANGGVTPSILSLISQNTSPGEQGKYLGLNQSVGSLSRIAGPIIGTALYDINLFLPYCAGAILVLLSLLVVKKLPSFTT